MNQRIISTAVLAVTILVAALLVAYHPHPFGWGAHHAPSSYSGFSGGGFDLSTP